MSLRGTFFAPGRLGPSRVFKDSWPCSIPYCLNCSLTMLARTDGRRLLLYWKKGLLALELWSPELRSLSTA